MTFSCFYIPKAAGVYALVNKVTGLIYVGGSEKNIQGRTRAHKNQLISKTHANFKLMRDVKRHGIDSFVCLVLEVCLPEDAFIREQFWIDTLNSANGGYNIKQIAQSSHNPPPQTGRIISEATRLKLSLALKGRQLNLTEEEREARRQAHRGFKHTFETREKQSRAKLGKPGTPHSEETKKRMSASRLGKKRGPYKKRVKDDPTTSS